MKVKVTVIHILMRLLLISTFYHPSGGYCNDTDFMIAWVKNPVISFNKLELLTQGKSGPQILIQRLVSLSWRHLDLVKELRQD